MSEHTTEPLKLHCDSIGAGPDLVILHGLFGSGENWRSQAQRLAKDFTVHCMDLRNHGASPHHAAMNYPDMATDVNHTCHELGVKKFHLLGHSMGGKAAMQLALAYPMLVDRLIIVDIAPVQYPHHHQAILEGLTRLNTQTISSRRDADDVLAAYVEDPHVRAFLLKNLQRTESLGYELQINLAAIVTHYDQIAAAISLVNSPCLQPTLFIKGANSDYLQTQHQAKVISMFPTAKLKTIGGAGHWPHSEKPDVVYKVVHDFLT